jgi:hypothetical protein
VSKGSWAEGFVVINAFSAQEDIGSAVKIFSCLITISPRKPFWRKVVIDQDKKVIIAVRICFQPGL